MSEDECGEPAAGVLAALIGTMSIAGIVLAEATLFVAIQRYWPRAPRERWLLDAWLVAFPFLLVGGSLAVCPERRRRSLFILTVVVSTMAILGYGWTAFVYWSHPHPGFSLFAGMEFVIVPWFQSLVAVAGLLFIAATAWIETHAWSVRRRWPHLL